MTTVTTPVRARTLAAILGIAAACRAVAVWRMNGMDMGAATPLGSFGCLMGLWVPMMAAVIAVFVLGQKLVGARAVIDVPLAFAIDGDGHLESVCEIERRQ